MSNQIFETTFNGYFWLSLAGILIGGLHLCLRYSERSKCKSCNICHCIKVNKDNDDDETPQTPQKDIHIFNRAKSNSSII